MPYKKFTCYKEGQKRWCTENLGTGKIVRYTSPENRETGIRMRETFTHGFVPTKIKRKRGLAQASRATRTRVSRKGGRASRRR